LGVVPKLIDAGLKMEGQGQGYVGQNAPVKEIERLLLDGKLDHRGHPVLRWMLNNCKVDRDAAGNVKLVKYDDKAKIDGIISGVMAMAALLSRNQQSGMPDNWTPDFI
jgi:phage terminase large subunit-like protein